MQASNVIASQVRMAPGPKSPSGVRTPPPEVRGPQRNRNVQAPDHPKCRGPRSRNVRMRLKLYLHPVEGTTWLPGQNEQCSVECEGLYHRMRNRDLPEVASHPECTVMNEVTAENGRRNTSTGMVRGGEEQWCRSNVWLQGSRMEQM